MGRGKVEGADRSTLYPRSLDGDVNRKKHEKIDHDQSQFPQGDSVYSYCLLVEHTSSHTAMSVGRGSLRNDVRSHPRQDGDKIAESL